MTTQTSDNLGELSLAIPAISDIIKGVEFPAKQAASAAGVSLRMWYYWTEQQAISPINKARGIAVYDWKTICKATLMRQALDQGITTVETAARIADDYLQREEQETLSDDDSDDNTLAPLLSRLHAAISSAEAHLDELKHLRLELYRLA